MVFKVLIYALRGLAILFLLLDIFQVGSFMWLSLVAIGLLLIVMSRKDFLNGKKMSAWLSIAIGLFIVIVSFVRNVAR